MVLLNKWCQMCVVQRSQDASARLAWMQPRSGMEDRMLECWAGGWAENWRLGEKMINGAYVVPTENSQGWADGLQKRLRLQSMRPTGAPVSVEVGAGKFLCSQWMRRSTARKALNHTDLLPPPVSGAAESLEKAVTSENGKAWAMLVINCAVASPV